MRASESMQHFSRRSIYEGGITGQHSDDDLEHLHDEEEEDEDMRLLGEHFQDKYQKAKDLIVFQITKQLQKYDIEGYNIHDIEFMRSHKWHILEDINISKNLLSNIDILNNYPNLKIVRANNCYISQVNLSSLRKLLLLDLNSNCLTEVPNLRNSQQLRELHLSDNEIFKVDNIQTLSNCLQEFDLSNNSNLKFNELCDFQKHITSQIKSMKELTVLKIDPNSFQKFSKDVIWEIVNNTQVREFNGDSMLVMKKKLEDGNDSKIINDPQDIMTVEELEDSEDFDDIGLKDKEYPPSLKKLLKSLEAAMSHPSSALDHLKHLASDVEKVVEKVHLVEAVFCLGLEETQIQESIETFIQNSLLLIDNSNQELQNIILAVLAKLSIISFQNFGLACFNTLKDVMKAGSEMEEQVKEFLQKEVIKKLRRSDPETIPVSLLIGLYELVEDTEMYDLVSGLIQTNYRGWLQKFEEKILSNKKRGAKMEDNEHYDSIIKLLSVSVTTEEDDANVERIIELDLIPYIVTIIQNSDWTNVRYIPCLNLIANLSNSSSDAATKFMEAKVYIHLLSEIKKSMQLYKVLLSLFDEDSVETIQEALTKYKTLAAQIKTLGGLLQCSDSEDRMKILNSEVVKDLISIMGHEETDPILLTAVCTFALDVFETEEVENNVQIMYPFYEGTKSMVELMPYLGGAKYPLLVEKCAKYHSIQEGNEGANEGPGESLDTDLLFGSNVSKINATSSTMIAAAEANKIRTAMSHLNDPLVIELLERIVMLLEYFSRQSVQNKNNYLHKAISNTLNEIGREDALFMCLEVPDDGIRVAVVSCLFVVPITDFSEYEIEQITKIVATCSNIGAGQTELVLSTLYWIMTKFTMGAAVQDKDQAIENSEDEIKLMFQRKYGDQAINEAMGILYSNLMRISETDGDDYEKYALSLSILNFLKAASEAPKMQKYFKQKGQIFKQILVNEDLYSTEIVSTIPIDIENTIMGSEMNVLIDAIQGQHSLQPYCDVSLRVLMRISDVLQYRHQCDPCDITGPEKDKVKLLRDHHEKSYMQRKHVEADFWVDRPIDFFMEKKWQINQREMIDQHNFFTVNAQGFNQLKNFLFNKVQINEEYLQKLSSVQFQLKKLDDKDQPKQQKQDDSEDEPEAELENLIKTITNRAIDYGAKFEKKYEVKDNLYKIREEFYKKADIDGFSQIENDECSSSEDEEDDENEADEIKAKKEVASKNSKPTKRHEYKMGMQYEDYGDQYLNSIIQVENNTRKEKRERDLQEAAEVSRKKQQAGMSQLPKYKRDDGFLNPYLRSLHCAAYLRCLYASIEYAPTDQLRQEAIKNIKEPFGESTETKYNQTIFHTITQLCDACNWDDSCNIAAKYLRVMRSIIEIPLKDDHEYQKRIPLYQILAIVIQKSQAKIVEKLKKDIQLTNGDQITIYEISLTFYMIINQVQHFEFSDKDIVNLYREKELAILKSIDKKKGEKDLPPSLQIDRSKSGPWRFKCEHDKSIVNKPNGQPKDFQVQVSVLRKKRSIQSKVVEFFVLKMFSKQSIFSLVDILFKDMFDDHENLKDPEEEEYDDDENAENTGQVEKKSTGSELEEGEQMHHESNKDDPGHPTRYGENLDDYLSNKGILTIERIKDIVGEIMNTCTRHMKYEIIEYIMRGVVFEKKVLRESFLQEILNAGVEAAYAGAIERYLNDEGLTTMEKAMEAKGEAHTMYQYVRHERVIEVSMVDINRTLINYKSSQRTGQQQKIETVNDQSLTNPNFLNRIFVLTNQGIQVLKNIPPKFRCPRCQRNEFCPKGPTSIYQVLYEDIVKIVRVPNMPQKLVIMYKTDKDTPYELEFQMTLNIPTITKTMKIYQQLISILAQVHAELRERILETRKANNEKTDKEEAIPKYNFFDIFVKFHLYELLKNMQSHKLLGDTIITQGGIKRIRMLFASLKRSAFLTKSYIRDKIERKCMAIETKLQDPKSEVGKKVMKYIQNINPNDQQEESQLVNAVLVLVVGVYIVILKEKWSHWSLCDDVELLQHHLEENSKVKNTEPFLAEYDPTRGVNPEVRQLLESWHSLNSQLFTVIQVINIQELGFEGGLRIHTGNIPSLELVYDIPNYKGFESDKNVIKEGDTHAWGYIVLKFPGDMERQEFIGNVISVYRGENLGCDDDDEENEEEENEDETDL